MSTTERSDGSTALPFTPDEYRGRIAKLCEALAERSLDAIYVTDPANLYYLTGYNSFWFDVRNATGVLVRVSTQEVTLFDSSDQGARAELCFYDELVLYDAEPHPHPAGTKAISAHLGQLPGQSRIGIERWSRTPGTPLLEMLAEECGRTVCFSDASYVVDRLRLYKSAAEVECVRQASAVVDAAYGDLAKIIAPGVTEIELAAELNLLMARHGGEPPALDLSVRSGPHLGLPHFRPTHRRLQPGDLIKVGTCGVAKRYHVFISRMFSLGENPEVANLLDRTSHIADAVVAGAALGAPVSHLKEMTDRLVDDEGLRSLVWWVGGYALGIAFPPDWTGHVFLSEEESVEPAELRPGYVTSYEVLMYDPDTPAAYIETLLATCEGVEVLSKVPRTLQVI